MTIPQVACAFPLSGQVLSCRPIGHGHINATYKICTDAGKAYILQRINTYVFKEPDKVMANACAVTEYLHGRKGGTALHFLSTHADAPYYQDDQGQFWRMYDFVDGFCLEAPERDTDFYESARAFGHFQELLADFPAHTLHETIPAFHNTPNRYRLLCQAIDADPLGRRTHAEAEIGFAMARQAPAGTLQRLREQGELPLRVTHNDTKLNNVLFHRQTRKPLCILDLDTVMPGLSLYDFGDAIRFGAATTAEDDPNAAKAQLDLHLFQVFTQGFLEAAPSLTRREIELLPMGAWVITMECGVRFLTDYLEGDAYFGAQYPDHNLIRAKTQFALAADMEKKWDHMVQIVHRIAAQVRS